MARPKIVTLAEGAMIIGRKRSTVANWSCQGYLTPVGQLPKTSPKGRPAFLYDLADIKAVDRKMPGNFVKHKPKPPAGYITAIEAGAIMGQAGSTVQRWFREGRIKGRAIPWGCAGQRSFIFILKSAALKFAAEKPVKSPKFFVQPKRSFASKDRVNYHPKTDGEVIERPAIYFRDSICLAARRAMFEARLAKPRNFVADDREVG